MALTPNLQMDLPSVETTLGPAWSQLLNEALERVDAHDHTGSGKGLRITPAALNINTTLPFGGNSATGLGLVRFENLTELLSGGQNARQLYVKGGELFYQDASGNNVQVTSGGSIVGSAGNITGLVAPAAVTYSSILKSFAFTQEAGVTADIFAGAISLQENVSGANAILIQSPEGLAGGYDLTLFEDLPASGSSLMSVGADGTLDHWALDDSSVEVDSGVVQLKDGGITEPKLADEAVSTRAIADEAVTREKLEGLGAVVSSSSGAFSTTSTSFTAVSNLSVNITTMGRPVLVLIESDGSGNGDGFLAQVTGGVSGNPEVFLEITEDGAQIYQTRLQLISDGNNKNLMVPASFAKYATPSAGSHTYAVRIMSQGPSITAWLRYARLVVIPL